MNKLLAILPLYLAATMIMAAQEFAGSSVLSGGRWHKIRISGEGIYSISFEELEQLGLSPGDEAALYSNNYGLLSYYNDDPRPDDLVKTAIHIERGNDGIFNRGDYILFYGNSTHRWKYNYNDSEYEFQRHYYSDTAVYFLKLNEPPLEIKQQAQPGQHNNTSSHSDYLFIHEIEKTNIMKSGREWYQPIAAGADHYFNTDLANYSTEEGAVINYKIRALARSSDPSVIRLNNGGEQIGSVFLPAVNVFNTAGTYASLVEERGEIAASAGSPELFITFHNNGNLGARAWLDYLVLQARIENSFMPGTHKHFIIRDKSSIQPGSITEFRLRSGSDDLIVWNINREHDVMSVQAGYHMGEYFFSWPTDSLSKFIAFRAEDARRPVIDNNPVPNQDLHRHGKYDMIIVTHPLFHEYAEELADIHLQNDLFVTRLVTPEEIYNEFSGGVPDISAIRNYLRMVYSANKETDKSLQYLLLFGDGSYDNKTPAPFNPNFIPSYQTQNSHIKIQSFTSDDYYGLLDAGEGEDEGLLDLGIGRLPVSDKSQAAAMIEKIRDYLDPSNAGPWRNIITMVADDEDNNIHMNDSEGLAGIIESEEPAFNIEKIYLDAYRQLTSISGDSYPGAVEAINNSVNRGCLILNYSGHGNELGLAHERVVNTGTINSWSNKGKYPVFVTATCEFSRFEDIDIDPGNNEISQKSSAGELVLLNPDGGAIALFSTTRIVFASHNFNLASSLYENAFDQGADGKSLPLGEIMRRAKINTSGNNKRNFALLGDPALRLAYPWHGRVITDSINGSSVRAQDDTLKALSELSVSGRIINNAGELLQDVNGYVYPVLYDKEREMTSLANDGGMPFNYSITDNILFRGKAEVINGIFSYSMLIPRDIDYTFGKGRISYFATGGSSDYAGVYNDFIIGGFSNSSLADSAGPHIELFINDTLFRHGGMTGPEPVLLALLSDRGSINTTGSGIGHDIVAVIDNDRSNPVILNNYYENDLGTYQSGKITYPLKGLNRGEHTVSLKAWDNFNNSSTASIMFFVRDEDGLILNRLINYPNPFINSTKISLEHNRPGDNIEITINIYTKNGQLVKTIKTSDQTGGYRLKPISWDGRDNSGKKVAAGSYFYTVKFKTEKNETSRISGQMVIL